MLVERKHYFSVPQNEKRVPYSSKKYDSNIKVRFHHQQNKIAAQEVTVHYGRDKRGGSALWVKSANMVACATNVLLDSTAWK